MSPTVHWRRNSPGGRCGSPSGVSALWNAYRWLLNITPCGPNAFFSSKLNMCATPSNTNTSSIMLITFPGLVRGQVRLAVADLRGRRQEPEQSGRPLGQPVGRPGLVPDDLDLSGGHPRLRFNPLLELGELPSGDWAPA